MRSRKPCILKSQRTGLNTILKTVFRMEYNHSAGTFRMRTWIMVVNEPRWTFARKHIHVRNGDSRPISAINAEKLYICWYKSRRKKNGVSNEVHFFFRSQMREWPRHFTRPHMTRRKAQYFERVFSNTCVHVNGSCAWLNVPCDAPWHVGLNSTFAQSVVGTARTRRATPSGPSRECVGDTALCICDQTLFHMLDTWNVLPQLGHAPPTRMQQSGVLSCHKSRLVIEHAQWVCIRTYLCFSKISNSSVRPPPTPPPPKKSENLILQFVCLFFPFENHKS